MSKYGDALRVSRRTPTTEERYEPVTCPCGCETVFVRRRHRQIYLNRRHRERHANALRAARLRPRLCRCGCGVRFTPINTRQVYARNKCRVDANNRRSQERLARLRRIRKAKTVNLAPPQVPPTGPSVTPAERAANRARIAELMRKVREGTIKPKVVKPDDFKA